jgi:hypothetical protein
MSVLCEKCHTKITAYESENRTVNEKKLIDEICKLTFSKFRQRNASGGKRYTAKIGKNEICLFIDTSDNARIMIEGQGRWLASVDFKGESDEKMLSVLQKILNK